MDFGSMVRPLEWIALGACAVALWLLGSSNRRKLESMSKLIDQLRAENETLERNARSVSHELMQPLGAITNYAEMIRLHSSGDVRGYASSILEVSAKTARGIRERGPGPARSADLLGVAEAASHDAQEHPAPRAVG